MTFKLKILATAMLPLILAMAAAGGMILYAANDLSDEQTSTLERSLIDSKKTELRFYTAYALNAISTIYYKAPADDEAAKEQVKKVLAELSYGIDGYFFVYDYAGNNIIHPRQGFRVGKNWLDLQDPEGSYFIRNQIAAARNGGGYTEFKWQKPYTLSLAKKVSYTTGLDKWQWMIGTSMYTDDISNQVLALKDGIISKTTRIFLIISILVLSLLAIVSAIAFYITMRQHRISSIELKALNQRIIETQEQERTRIARELHDGISQQLTSTKYMIELAQIQSRKKTASAGETISRSVSALASSISEIRRISRNLRPAMLDDLGLAPALESLCSEFNAHSRISLESDIHPVRSKLSDGGKTALFRIAQEALNNIIRHADASEVKVSLETSLRKVTLIISDNGKGFNTKPDSKKGRGIGLTNMAERVAYYDGSFKVSSNDTGTTIQAQIATMDTAPPVKEAAE